jgi:hypothetical protein
VDEWFPNASIAGCGPRRMDKNAPPRMALIHPRPTRRNVFDLLHILYLFYSIVLTFINYVGPRTDFLTTAHPAQNWPSAK